MYNTNTEKIDFYGNTHIRSGATDIYCQLGWYNTLTDQTELYGRAKMINGSSILIGDTLFTTKAELEKAYKNIFSETH